MIIRLYEVRKVCGPHVEVRDSAGSPIVMVGIKQIEGAQTHKVNTLTQDEVQRYGNTL